MARYKMARSDAPVHNHCEGGRIVGGDETHVEIELPDGAKVSDALVPMGSTKKKAKKAEAETVEDE